MRRLAQSFAAGFAVVVGTLLSHTPLAEACGGLFWEDGGPEFLQQAEDVVFVAGGDGTVTALVHILHTGGERSFAWLLPVPGTPEVGLSTRRTFEGLLDRTTPRFATARNYCEPANISSKNGVTSGNNDANNFSVNNDGGGGQVQILDEGLVGPYVYETITVTGGGDASGEVARTWLVDNGYGVDDGATALLGSYLDAGMNIIAFKLESSASSRDIRPVSLRMQTDDVMLPLRLASVGAVEDTALRVWLLGPARAVSTNVPEVELNECLFDWIEFGENYIDVLDAAVDEAGGQAFVAELSGISDFGEIALSSRKIGEPWDDALDAGFTDRQLVNHLAMNFVDEDGMFAALREASIEVDFDCVHENIDPVEGEITCAILSPRCDCVLDLPADFVRQDFLDVVDRLVVEPARQTQALLESQPIVTALHTRISPDEMDVDPMFAFNGEAPTIARVRRAQSYDACEKDGTWVPEFSRWELPGDYEVWVAGTQWPLAPGGDLPAAARIVQYGPSGAPEVLEDRREQIREAVAAHNAQVTSTLPAGVDAEPGAKDGTDGCNCGVAGREDPPALVWVIALTLVALFTRRRNFKPEDW